MLIGDLNSSNASAADEALAKEIGFSPNTKMRPMSAEDAEKLVRDNADWMRKRRAEMLKDLGI